MTQDTQPDQVRRRPAGAALFIHLLDRYVNDAPNKTALDQAIAKALNSNAQSKELLKPHIEHWKAIPVERRRVTYGADFGDLRADTTVVPVVMEHELRAVLTRPLAQIAPGIRGTSLPEDGADDGDIPPRPSSLSANIAHAALLSTDAAAPRAANLASSAQSTYRIDFAGIYCKKETPPAWGGSDEPYVLFTTTQRFREPWATRSVVYDDVDTGDDRGPLPPLLSLFGQSEPEAADETAVTATVMEHDLGDPDALKEKVRLGVKAAQAVAAAYNISIPDAVANFVTEIINDLLGTGDDLIGASAVVLDPGAFGFYAQQPLTHFKAQLDYHFFTYHEGGGGKYYVMYRVVQAGSTAAKPTSILAYNQGNGQFATGRLQADGSFDTVFVSEPGSFSHWTHFVGGGNGAVLAYNQVNGQFATGFFNADGTYHHVFASKPGAFSPWTHFASGGNGSILTYNQANGQFTTGRLQADGSFDTLFVSEPGSFSHWTHITGAGNGALLFYNHDNGQFATGFFDTDYIYRHVFASEPGSFSPWTHFASGGNGSILTYNQANGQFTTGRLQADGSFDTLFVSEPGSFSHWTHITGAGNGALLFYNHDNGQFATGFFDTDYIYRHVFASEPGSFSPWTHLVGA